MPFEAKLTGEAASLARAHDDVLRRLPATVHAFILVDLQKWDALFPAEQRYQRALLEHLSQQTPEALTEVSGGITRVEAEGALNRISERDPARFQDLAQSSLRKQNLVTAWRREVDLFFQQIDPALEARLYPPDAPRRVVLQLYGDAIAVQPDKLWSRFRANGVRIPLRLDGVKNSGDYLRALFGVTSNSKGDIGSSLFSTLRSDAAFAPTDTWIVEAHRELHDLVHQESADGRPTTGLSYERLLPYRDMLMRALFSKIQSGVESPQAFAAYARGLKLAPEPGALLNPTEVVQAFVRDVLLTGNGTLFVNNTFVEWAAAQALRRAQPRMLVARYGVRDKLKPFSSLLLFSQPRTSDVIPLIEDPVGSFIDVEQLAYYVWVHAEKSAAYRSRTLYLFLAENVPEMLAIRANLPASAPAAAEPVSLADVRATMANWLGIRAPEGSGRPIAPLIV
jgi:hypothetical protein